MWIDSDDRMINIFGYLDSFEGENFPATCPICRKKDVHIFLFRYNKNSDFGGAWIWCSNCRNSTHFTCNIPKYWKNMDLININNLSSNFDNLEMRKLEIDCYFNIILNNKIEDKINWSNTKKYNNRD